MNRRTMIALSVAGGAGIASVPRPAWARARHSGRDDSPEMKAAVAGGVGYFSKRCNDQIALCRKLENAIASGDLQAAQQAYIDARPPYEEIETLAYAFEDTDRDIDARPYAFEAGETDDDFRGFHKIEAMLFGYKNLDDALPYAKRLSRSIAQLQKQLGELDRFDAEGQFGGMYALTNEVAAKKISSEEEAWSDQTLLIFKHNWIGAYSQFQPFAPLVARSNPQKAAAVKIAFDEAMETLKPHFKKGVIAATPYTKVGMTERRTMADASNRMRDAIANASVVIGVDTGIS
ncbi:MAG: EfeM/EfeO family lipoprotein [Phycisphaerales bacterium]|nr:EfeM/EfeO family lipoprotein [Phycisphaerales bacterium]